MGQNTSEHSFSALNGSSPSSSTDLDFLHEQIRRHSLTLRQMALITYDDLRQKIVELNTLSMKYLDCNGRRIIFNIKEGTDSGMLWKGTIRIKCVIFDDRTDTIDKTRDLNLKQFLQAYNTLQTHMSVAVPNNDAAQAQSEMKGIDTEGPFKLSDMSSSLLFEKVTELDSVASSNSDDCCCICMERKPEVSLPCTHSYCLACIERWNVDHKTCPNCREILESTDQTWILEGPPNEEDVNKEIQKSLFSLTS